MGCTAGLSFSPCAAASETGWCFGCFGWLHDASPASAHVSVPVPVPAPVPVIAATAPFHDTASTSAAAVREPLALALGFSSQCFWLWRWAWAWVWVRVRARVGLGLVQFVPCGWAAFFWVEMEPHKFLVSSRSSSLNASVCVCVSV